MSCKTEKDVFESFLEFLSKCSPVILCGHNTRRFDDVILKRYITNLGLANRFESLVIGYADTLIVLRERTNLSRYNMNFLKEYYDTKAVATALFKKMNNGSKLLEFLNRPNNLNCFVGQAHDAVMDCLHLICILEMNKLLNVDVFRSYV